jgi:hypothetical protein
MRKLPPLLAALVLGTAIHAQDVPANVGELKLNTTVPLAGNERVEIGFTLQETPPPAVTAPAAAPTPAVGVGVPRIPGAGDVQTQGVSPGTAAADPVQPATPEPLTKSFMPGEPVPTYATMQAAADAGIEPLPTLPREVTGPLPAVDPYEEGFNWGSAQAYLQWFQERPTDVMLYGGGGLSVLTASAWVVLRREIGRG